MSDWITKSRRAFFDEEADVQRGSLFSDEEEDDDIIDDFLDEKFDEEEAETEENLTDDDVVIISKKKRQKQGRAKHTQPPKKKERPLLCGLSDDELESDNLATLTGSCILDHSKFRVIPPALRSVIPQSPLVVFRGCSTFETIVRNKIFIGIDPGIRNLGISIAIPTICHFENQTRSIVPNAQNLDSFFDHNSVNYLLQIATCVDSIMDSIRATLEDFNHYTSITDVVLCIEQQYVGGGPGMQMMQRLLLLGCRLEMCFLDWCARHNKGLHIQRVNSGSVAATFLRKADTWSVFSEINAGLGAEKIIRKNWGIEMLPMEIHDLVQENIHHYSKKKKAIEICNRLACIVEQTRSYSNETIFKLPFTSAATDHEADANLCLAWGIIQILKQQVAVHNDVDNEQNE